MDKDRNNVMKTQRLSIWFEMPTVNSTISSQHQRTDFGIIDICEDHFLQRSNENTHRWRTGSMYFLLEILNT
jgi:hypothetical protein